MIFFGSNAIPPSWTLKLPESWGESKTDFKGEVDGFKIEEGGGGGEKKIKKKAGVFCSAVDDFFRE